MKKIGRNDSCHCGSGKKHKKCCLGKTASSVESAQKSGSSNTALNDKKGLLTTTTGELHMPVRLYYEVHNKVPLTRVLNQLRCIEQVAEDRWKLTYDEEAKKFGLPVKYNKATPIVIGYIHLVNDDLLHIDVRSFKRAARMIEFIDRHVDRQFAKITHAASYTKAMPITKEAVAAISGSTLDYLFMPDTIEEINPEVITQELKDIADKHENQDEKQNAIFNKLANDARRQKPLVEKYPVHFYEDGIGAFECALAITEEVAIKHSQGDKSYSTHDAIMAIAKNMMGKLEGEPNLEKTFSPRLEKIN